MYLGAQVRYKVQNEKVRFTFCGLICSGKFEGWKPAYISKCQGSKWDNRQSTVETKRFKNETGDYIEIKRRIFRNFVVYSNSRAWMNSHVWTWEGERLSIFIQKKYPGRKMCLLVDNCPSHKMIRHPNLEMICLPKNCTGFMQPLGGFSK